MKAFLLSFLIAMCCSAQCFGQSSTPTRLRVFLDCSAGCDNNYIKSEITIVDFVLDRLAADVHILINSRTNGGGGETVQLAFFGQNAFAGRGEKIQCDIPAIATAAEKREMITHRIKLGLVPYLSNASADLVKIEMKKKELINGSVARKNDKWNYWVYRIGTDGSLNSDQNYQSLSASAYLSANRTTDKLRLNFYAYSNYNFATYSYEDNGQLETYEVVNTTSLLSHYLVKSLSQHWSVGYEAYYNNSTFSNYKSRLYLSPALEYAIFPYRDMNEKFFAISYGPELMSNVYYDTTIYNQTEELLLGHKVRANLSVRQKWGTITSAINYSNYLKDWQLNNVSASLNLDIRITGGLSFYLYTSGGLVHDQVYLVKGDATQQQILTRQRQLATSYTYYTGFGITYRFGSILNNFVNPRFPNY
jgi:hypothetical protein